MIRFVGERPSGEIIQKVMSRCGGRSFWVVTGYLDYVVTMVNIDHVSEDSCGEMGTGDTGFCGPLGVKRPRETWTAVGLDGLPLEG